MTLDSLYHAVLWALGLLLLAATLTVATGFLILVSLLRAGEDYLL